MGTVPLLPGVRADPAYSAHTLPSILPSNLLEVGCAHDVSGGVLSTVESRMVPHRRPWLRVKSRSVGRWAGPVGFWDMPGPFPAPAPVAAVCAFDE